MVDVLGVRPFCPELKVRIWIYGIWTDSHCVGDGGKVAGGEVSVVVMTPTAE